MILNSRFTVILQSLGPIEESLNKSSAVVNINIFRILERRPARLRKFLAVIREEEFLFRQSTIDYEYMYALTQSSP